MTKKRIVLNHPLKKASTKDVNKTMMLNALQPSIIRTNGVLFT